MSSSAADMVAVMSLMESPAVIMGIMLVRMFAARKAAEGRPPRHPGDSPRIVLQRHGVALDRKPGDRRDHGAHGGRKPEAVHVGSLQGNRALVLLDVGMLAAKKAGKLIEVGPKLVAFGILAPVANAAIGIGIAYALGMSRGRRSYSPFWPVLFYIVVPAAMRQAVPEANPGLFELLSLSVTFPFNISVGFPFSTAWSAASGPDPGSECPRTIRCGGGRGGPMMPRAATRAGVPPNPAKESVMKTNRIVIGAHVCRPLLRRRSCRQPSRSRRMPSAPCRARAAIPSKSVAFDGGSVYSCCGNCQKAFEGDSSKFAAKAHLQMVSTGQLVQKGCPVQRRSGEAGHRARHRRRRGRLLLPELQGQGREGLGRRAGEPRLRLDREGLRAGGEVIADTDGPAENGLRAGSAATSSTSVGLRARSELSHGRVRSARRALGHRRAAPLVLRASGAAAGGGVCRPGRAVDGGRGLHAHRRYDAAGGDVVSARARDISIGSSTWPRAEAELLDARPDVCVLVDFPGFHWRLAWRAKRHGIPVVFYCPPRSGLGELAKEKMRRLVDHVLSALPFEHDWFLANGITSTLRRASFFDRARGAGREPRGRCTGRSCSSCRDREARRSRATWHDPPGGGGRAWAVADGPIRGGCAPRAACGEDRA